MSYKDAYEKHVAGGGYAAAYAKHLKESTQEAPKAEEHAPEVAAKEEPSLTSAFGKGAAQGATLDFGDEAQGIIQAVGNKLTGYHDHEGANAPSFLQDYRAERDAARGENDAAKEAHSWAYGAGGVVGTIGTAPALAGGKAVSGVKAVAKAGAITGAKIGALLGLGGSRAEAAGDTPAPLDEQIQLMKDVGKGGAIGAATGPIAALGGLAGSKVLGFAGTKIADSARGIGALFGRDVGVNLDRAAASLGAKVGAPSADPLLTDALENGAIDRIAPSTLNSNAEAAKGLARVSARPEVQSAEQAAKFEMGKGVRGSKEALKNQPKPPEIDKDLRDLASDPSVSKDWARNSLAEKEAATASHAATESGLKSDLALLEELSARKLPSAGTLSSLISGANNRLGPVGKALQEVVAGDSSHLARALADPAKARELALLLASGRTPNLQADALKALTSRAMAVIAAPDTSIDRN